MVLVFQGPNSQVMYYVTGDYLAQQYFRISAETGEVSVQKSLLTDSSATEEYRVSLHIHVWCH